VRLGAEVGGSVEYWGRVQVGVSCTCFPQVLAFNASLECKLHGE